MGTLIHVRLLHSKVHTKSSLGTRNQCSLITELIGYENIKHSPTQNEMLQTNQK